MHFKSPSFWLPPPNQGTGGAPPSQIGFLFVISKILRRRVFLRKGPLSQTEKHVIHAHPQKKSFWETYWVWRERTRGFEERERKAGQIDEGILSGTSVVLPVAGCSRVRPRAGKGRKCGRKEAFREALKKNQRAKPTSPPSPPHRG